MSKTNTIPDFNNTPESIGTSLRAVKNILEQMTGQSRGESLGAPNIYVQTTQPVTSGAATLKKGDFWINETTSKMSYWNGSIWKALVLA